MTQSAEMKLVVLYEDEIRKAAKLLDQAFNSPDDWTDKQQSDAYIAALSASRVALYHPALMEDSSILMLTAGDPFGRTKK